MYKLIKWTEILESTDLVGGVVEISYDVKRDGRYRGLISQAKLVGRDIMIRCPWIVRWCDEGWTFWKKNPEYEEITIPCNALGQDIEGERFEFVIPQLGKGIIFLNGASHLVPENVLNIPSASIRLLNLYPDLALDRQKAADVCRSGSFSKSCTILECLPESASLLDYIRSFRSDSTAEEFLWHYIELMTGEENIHEKVY